MARVVAQEDALFHIYAFLESCGYSSTIQALQTESGVPYNVIHSVSQAPTARRTEQTPRTAEALEVAVLEGNWFEVLSRYADDLLLPQDVKETLYETVFEELLDLHGLREAARALLAHSPVFKEMKNRSPARYARLDGLLQHFNAAAVEERAVVRAATPAEVQTKREHALRQLLAHVHFSSEPYDGFLPAALAAAQQRGDPSAQVPSVRAAKRPREDGATTATSGAYAEAVQRAAHPTEVPTHVQTKIAFAEDALVASCAALPETASSPALALLGHANGVLDFVDPATGLAVGASVAHTAGVLSLAIDCPSNQPPWVAVGYRDGTVKVYNAETRKLVRRFPTVHALGVTCLTFLGSTLEEGLSGHHGLLVTGSFDTTLHVLSLSQGGSLCQIRGGHHDAFINAVHTLRGPSEDEERAYFLSAGNDGALCAWAVQRRFASGSPTRCHRIPEATAALGALYKPAGNAIPTALLSLPAHAPSSAETSSITTTTTTTTELAVLTRSNLVLVLSVDCRSEHGNATVAAQHTSGHGDGAEAVSYTVLCAIDVHRPVRFGACLVSASSTLSVPMLSLYVSDADGTILLFNTAMAWRDAEKWAQHGGTLRVTQCTAQTAAIVVDVGESVSDLHLACFARTQSSAKVRLVACAPSLRCAYLLD